MSENVPEAKCTVETSKREMPVPNLKLLRSLRSEHFPTFSIDKQKLAAIAAPTTCLLIPATTGVIHSPRTFPQCVI